MEEVLHVAAREGPLGFAAAALGPLSSGEVEGETCPHCLSPRFLRFSTLSVFRAAFAAFASMGADGSVLVGLLALPRPVKAPRVVLRMLFLKLGRRRESRAEESRVGWPRIESGSLFGSLPAVMIVGARVESRGLV